MNYIVSGRYNNSNKFGRSIVYYLKIVVSRMFYVFLILLSMFMLIKQKKNPDIFDNTRKMIFFVSKPQIFTIKIVDGIINKFSFTINYFSGLRKENVLLKKENLDLRVKLLNLNILEQENQDLKEVLNFTTKNNILDYSIRKINILNNKDFINRATIKINDSNTKENDLVVDSKGNLVGRVINVSGNYAEVLLLTDITSKVPARLNNSRVRVLLTGNESKNLNIEFFLGEQFNINEGELVFTSSDGNIIQEGIAIGKVVKDKKGKFKVEINSHLDRVNNVIILHNSNYRGNDINRIDGIIGSNEDKNVAEEYVAEKIESPVVEVINKTGKQEVMDEGDSLGLVEVGELGEESL